MCMCMSDRAECLAWEVAALFFVAVVAQLCDLQREEGRRREEGEGRERGEGGEKGRKGRRQEGRKEGREGEERKEKTSTMSIICSLYYTSNRSYLWLKLCMCMSDHRHGDIAQSQESSLGVMGTGP